MHPLSNHYKYDLSIWDECFKSNEHAYFWRMATDMEQPDMAEKIKNAKHAGAAKAISKDIADEATKLQWALSVGIDVMRELQYTKCYQCPEFLQCIYEKKDCYFAEANPSKIWASGLSEYVTKNTSPKFWPGKNKLGEIMNEISIMVNKVITDVTKPGGVVQMFEMLEFDELTEIERLLKEAIPSTPTAKSDQLPETDSSETESSQAVPSTLTAKSDQLPETGNSEKDSTQAIPCTPTSQSDQIIETDSSENININNENDNSTVKFPNPFQNVADKVKDRESAARPRRNSLSTSTRITDEKESFPKNLDEFYVYLDKYAKKESQKRKNTESSPDSIPKQEPKAAKIDKSSKISTSNNIPESITPDKSSENVIPSLSITTNSESSESSIPESVTSSSPLTDVAPTEDIVT